MIERSTKLIIVLGYNGTGKTTFTKKLVNVEIKKPTGKALIVTPDDNEWNDLPMNELNKKVDFDYKGAKRTIYLEDFTLERIKQYYHNGLLVFDDCRSYFTSSVTLYLHNLLIRRRQKMLDIVAVGHGFTEVPPKFFTFCSDIVLFQTKDDIFKRKNDILQFDKVKEAADRVNKKAEQFPHYYEVIKM